MSKISITREHRFAYAHRLTNHPGACIRLHGHEGNVVFHLEAEELDEQGMITDFGTIKSALCKWIDSHWDHRCFIYEKDEIADRIKDIDPEGVVLMPFNPTSENMAKYLLKTIGPEALADYDCKLVRVDFHETSNCFASAHLNN